MKFEFIIISRARKILRTRKRVGFLLYTQRHNEVVNFYVAVNEGVDEDVTVILMGNSCEQIVHGNFP